MPQLQFKGKQFVQNYHFTVPYRVLKPVPSKSFPKGRASLDDNLIIHGDNLAALKALLPKYAGQIKCIYIDPPYNTGNEHWIYSDNVNSPMMKEWLGKEVGRDDLARHDKWLCMMMPRLKLLRELLRDDGVIFVSIDDNEAHHLKMLMDEIFGEENFITKFVWEKTQHFGRQSKNYYSNCEYILAYAKELYAKELKELLVEKIKTEFEDAPLYNASNKENKLVFPAGTVIFNLKDGIYSKTSDKKYKLLDKVIVENGTNKNDLILSFRSRWSQKTINKEIEKGAKFWIKSENFAIRVIYGSDKSFKDSPKQIIFTNKNNPFVARDRFDNYVGTTEEGTSELEEIFGIKGIFDYPKPSSLIKYLLSLYFNEKEEKHDNDFIVLDSFAGTGTTGHAVLALNKEDGGNRKFILVEMEDYADRITAERMRRVIKGVPTAKDENLKNGLGGSFTFVELGEAIDNEGILSGKRLPSFIDMARYVFYTATGKNINEKKIKESTGFIGETEEYEVYLLYKPDLEWLKTTALDLEKAKKIAGKKGGKKKLVFAPAKYLDEEALKELNIEFAQLPFGIYRR